MWRRYNSSSPMGSASRTELGNPFSDDTLEGTAKALDGVRNVYEEMTALDFATERNRVMMTLAKKDQQTRDQLGQPAISTLGRLIQQEIIQPVEEHTFSTLYSLSESGKNTVSIKTSENYLGSCWNILKMLTQSPKLSRSKLDKPSHFQLLDMQADGLIQMTTEVMRKESIKVYSITPYGRHYYKSNKRRFQRQFYKPKPVNLVKHNSGKKAKLRTDWRDRKILAFKLREVSARTQTAGWTSAGELRPLLEAEKDLDKTDIEQILFYVFPKRSFSEEDFLSHLPLDRTQWTLQERYHALCWRLDRDDMWKRQRIYQALDDAMKQNSRPRQPDGVGA